MCRNLYQPKSCADAVTTMPASPTHPIETLAHRRDQAADRRACRLVHSPHDRRRLAEDSVEASRCTSISGGWRPPAGCICSARCSAASFGIACCGRWGKTSACGRAAGLSIIGHLGKYVPGKAMVVILRAGMIRGPGVDAPLAVVSVFFETLTMMAVGALMAAGIVAVWFRGQPLLFWASLGMMAVAGLPTLPPVFRRLVRIVGLGRLSPAATRKTRCLGYGTVVLGWAAERRSAGLYLD